MILFRILKREIERSATQAEILYRPQEPEFLAQLQKYLGK